MAPYLSPVVPRPISSNSVTAVPNASAAEHDSKKRSSKQIAAGKERDAREKSRAISQKSRNEEQIWNQRIREQQKHNEYVPPSSEQPQMTEDPEETPLTQQNVAPIGATPIIATRTRVYEGPSNAPAQSDPADSLKRPAQSEAIEPPSDTPKPPPPQSPEVIDLDESSDPPDPPHPNSNPTSPHQYSPTVVATRRSMRSRSRKTLKATPASKPKQKQSRKKKTETAAEKGLRKRKRDPEDEPSSASRKRSRHR